MSGSSLQFQRPTTSKPVFRYVGQRSELKPPPTHKRVPTLFILPSSRTTLHPLPLPSSDAPKLDQSRTKATGPTELLTMTFSSHFLFLFSVRIWRKKKGKKRKKISRKATACFSCNTSQCSTRVNTESEGLPH